MGLHLMESVGRITYNRACADDFPSCCPITREANLSLGQAFGPGTALSASFDNIQHGITSYSPIVRGLGQSSRDAREEMSPGCQIEIDSGAPLNSGQTIVSSPSHDNKFSSKPAFQLPSPVLPHQLLQRFAPSAKVRVPVLCRFVIFIILI